MVFMSTRRMGFLLAGRTEEAFARPKHDRKDRQAESRRSDRARSGCVRVDSWRKRRFPRPALASVFATWSTASPFSTVPLFHRPCSARVEDTTYLGMPVQPVRPRAGSGLTTVWQTTHHCADPATAPRRPPPLRAGWPSSSRSFFPNRENQPPSLKPSWPRPGPGPLHPARRSC